MEENRKKEKRKILPKKTLFWSFFLKNVRRRIVKHFFYHKFFVNYKSNNKESKHNERTHEERTNQEEEVKRKNKENQSFFRVFFWRETKRYKIFSKKKRH